MCTSLAWHRDNLRPGVRVSVLCKVSAGGVSRMRVAGQASNVVFQYSQVAGSFAVMASQLFHASVRCTDLAAPPVLKVVFFFE